MQPTGIRKLATTSNEVSGTEKSAGDPVYDLAKSVASSKPSKLELYGLPLAFLVGKGLLGASLGAGTSYLGEKLIPIEGETSEGKSKNRRRSILAGAGFGVGSGLLDSIALYNQLLSQQKQANWSFNVSNDISIIAKIAATNFLEPTKEADWFNGNFAEPLERLAATVRGAAIGKKIAPGLLAGALTGGGIGLLDDPGYDEYTGKRKSRLSRMLDLGLTGSIIGGGSSLVFPGAAQVGSNIGGRLGGLLHELRKRGEDTHVASKQLSRDRDEKEEKPDRKRLGPLEHAYIADSIGGRASQNTGRKLKEMHQDPENPYQDLYDRFITLQGGLRENLGERISRGSARMAESPFWRALSMLDPTASGQHEGIVGALSGFGGGEDKAEGAKQRAAEAYVKFLKKYQDKFAPNTKTTERETPYHVNAQGMLANLDSDIAGHVYMRNERPLHYWLNPLSKAGPLSELGDRGSRRIVAAQASPESTLGRFGMGVGSLATLGVLPMFMGGEDAQQKLRASAVKNRIYAPEATPEEKDAGDIALLARLAVKQSASRCWTGYEPVPGKTPYSEDSCRPVGSKPKKKEKKAKSDWHEYAEMTKDVDPEFQDSRQEMLNWIKETSGKRRKKSAGCGCSAEKKCDKCGNAPCECGSNLDVTRLAKLAVDSLKYPTSFYPQKSDLFFDMAMQDFYDKSPSPWFKSDISSRRVPARYFGKPIPPKPPSTPIPYVGKVPYSYFLDSIDNAVHDKNWQQIDNPSFTPVLADPSNVKNKDYSLARSFMTPRTVLSGKALKTNNPFAGK